MQESDRTLVEPLSVTVFGVATDIGKTSSTPAKVDKKRDKSSKAKKAGTSVSKKLLNQKWSDRFSCLEAMLLSTTFNQPTPVFQSVVGPSTDPPPAGAVDNNQPFFKPQTNQPTTNRQEPTNSPATVQQPANWRKTDNRPSSTAQHQLTIPPATHSQQPPHRSGNRPTTASTHQPQLLTISSLLTGLRLITGPVLHLLTNNRSPKRPLFISSPLTSLRLINLDLIPATHLYRSSNHQRLIRILALIQIMTLLCKN